MKKKIKVAYQGIAGAYSHLACLNYFSSNIICIENETFKDAMNMVESNQVDYAVIPIENKTAGRVEEFYELIPTMKLQIVGEYYQKIEHCLLGIEESIIDDITIAYSHPQGLAQCRNHLKELKIKPIAKYDTAGSAKKILNLQKKHLSAIASSLAANIYNLKILKKNIEDEEDNFTRFLILSKKQNIIIEKDQNYVTSIIFQLENISSSLYQALGGLANNNINILKIESYIPLRKTNESHFHIDVDGFPENLNLQKAFFELKKHVKKFKVLGTYKKVEL